MSRKEEHIFLDLLMFRSGFSSSWTETLTSCPLVVHRDNPTPRCSEKVCHRRDVTSSTWVSVRRRRRRRRRGLRTEPSEGGKKHTRIGSSTFFGGINFYVVIAFHRPASSELTLRGVGLREFGPAHRKLTAFFPAAQQGRLTPTSCFSTGTFSRFYKTRLIFIYCQFSCRIITARLKMYRFFGSKSVARW